jgi:hypothetical protein
MVVSLLLLFCRENSKSFERKISTIVAFAAHYCNVAKALYIILSFVESSESVSFLRALHPPFLGKFITDSTVIDCSGWCAAGY